MIFTSGGAVDYNAMISNTANESNPGRTTIGNQNISGIPNNVDVIPVQASFTNFGVTYPVSSGNYTSIPPSTQQQPKSFWGSALDLAKTGLSLYNTIAPAFNSKQILSTIEPQVVLGQVTSPGYAPGAEQTSPNGSNTTIILPNGSGGNLQAQGTQQAAAGFSIDPLWIIGGVLAIGIFMLLRGKN